MFVGCHVEHEVCLGHVWLGQACFLFFSFFFFLRFIYLFIHDRQRERERERERERGRDTGGGRSRLHAEPDVGLNPGIPGSCPGPKAGTKPLSHPGTPYSHTLCYNNRLSKH